jgi:ornithine cyclodeaminase/alanine dehydrogenase-like protein (mu-crystallin family)
MTQEKILYLSRSDVEAAGPSMAEIILALETMFLEKAAGRTEMPPKPGIHTRPDTFIHAMPAYIPSTGAAGMKWVSSYPSNRSLGLPNISGLIVLNDPETGLPVAIMDCSWITAKRTGAATAVAAKLLARREARTAGILGCGVQGRSNLEALRAVFPLTRITAYDNDPGVLSGFVAEAALGTGMEVVAARVPEEAVRGAEIVVTAGPIVKVPHATIRPGWLEAGAFASLVDYDSYWDRRALAEVDKFCTDDIPQMDFAKSMGFFKEIPPVYAELADLVSGRRPGRENARERTMACNLGLALDDMATAPLVLRRAREMGLGTRLRP